MKTTKLLLSLALVCLCNFSYAIDRIVQENGPAGTFATITEAITAAVNGDRIIVHPKIGGSPYIEEMIIDKSLEIVSATDGIRYRIQGNIVINALNNRTVTLIGVHLVTGNITGATAGWRTNVNIMGCQLDGGNINFNNQYYVNIVSNILQNGGISISHGRIIGNELMNESLGINIANSNSIVSDRMEIIANKVTQIFCSSDIFLNIQNNLMRRIGVLTSSGFSTIRYTFSSTENKLNILNNTILVPIANSNQTRGSYFNLSSKAIIKNNIIQNSSTTSSNNAFASLIDGTASSYNYFRAVIVHTETSPTDITLTSNIVNQNTGQLILPSPALNGADPSFEFYDLDLSPGDAGCFGGSYSLDNYFPITGSSRVFWVDVPFGITTTGAPLQIKAEGFDR